MKRSGFSLIEMLAVLTIIAMVAAAVSFRWSDTSRRAIFQNSIDQVVNFQTTTRSHSKRAGIHGKLTIDLEKNKLSGSRWSAGRESERSFELPVGVELASIRTVAGEITSGKYEISVSNLGAMPTLAIKLSQNNRQQWVVFAGRSGQTLFYDQDDDVKSLFNKLRTKRIDSN